jgi:hypothetical protein
MGNDWTAEDREQLARQDADKYQERAKRLHNEIKILQRKLKIATGFFDDFREYVHKGGNMTTLEVYRQVTEIQKKIEKVGKHGT